MPGLVALEGIDQGTLRDRRRLACLRLNVVVCVVLNQEHASVVLPDFKRLLLLLLFGAVIEKLELAVIPPCGGRVGRHGRHGGSWQAAFGLRVEVGSALSLMGRVVLSTFPRSSLRVVGQSTGLVTHDIAVP